MKYFAVIYDYVPSPTRVADVRPRHREFLAGLKEQGFLLGSGPFVEGDPSALIILRLDDSAGLTDAEKMMDDDPFAHEKLIKHRSIREWNPVLNVFEN